MSELQHPTFLKDLVRFIYFSFLPACVRVSPAAAVKAVGPPSLRKKREKKPSDCRHQESRPERTAGVQSWKIGLNLHTQTQHLVQRVSRAALHAPLS